MKKFLDRLTAAALAVIVLAGAQSCMRYEKQANTSTSGTMTMVCDDTFENIMNQEVDVFEYQYPDAHVLVRYATQSEAIDSLMSLNTKTIVIARDLTKDEMKYLKSKRNFVRSSKIAVDAVAFIVNPANECNKLMLKELSQILSGETTEWNEVMPSKLGKIRVVLDRSGSSLAAFLRDSLLAGAPLADNVYAAGSVPGVFEAVEKDKNAIGVLGVSWISSDMDAADIAPEELAKSVLSEDPVQGATLSRRVKVLPICRNNEVTAYRPYQENIFNGTYPLFRQIYMITTAHSGTTGGGFYSFVTGDIGQKIIMKTGIMPARMRIQVVQLGE